MMLLAQITDLHIDNEVPELQHLDARAQTLAVLDELRRQKVEELFVTGDIAETHSGAEWFVELLAQWGFQTRLLMGNHDLAEIYIKKGLLGHPKAYFALDQEGFRLLFLDSANYSVDQEQLAWLAAELAQAKDEILIFIHHPVLDCGQTLMDQRYPLKNRDQVLECLLQSQRKITLFCGHYHAEAVVEQGQILQYVTPAVLYQLKKYSTGLETEHETPGYRLLRLENGTFTTEVRYLE
jgi:Icc protein